MSPSARLQKKRSGKANGNFGSALTSRHSTSSNSDPVEVGSSATKPGSIISASLLRSGRCLMESGCFIHRTRNAI